MVNKPIVDGILLVVCLLAALLFSVMLFRNPVFTGRKWPVFLMAFFAMNPFLNMGAHLTAIGLSAFFRMRQGLFVYDFRFYSLQLMGVVFMLLSGYLLHQIKGLSRGRADARQKLLAAGTLQILFSVPLFPINPIGVQPALATFLLWAVFFATGMQKTSRKPAAIPVYQ